MSLSKIPFIVASYVGARTAYTHRSPPPLEYKRMLEEVPFKLGSLVVLTKPIMLGLLLLELAIATANTSTVQRVLPVSQRLLGVLFSAQNASKLRIVPQSALGALLVLCGGAIRGACYRQMGRHFTGDLAIQKDHKLITGGPYSVVRHPSYTGGIMAIIGLAMFHVAPGSFMRESRVWDTNLGKFCASLIIAMTLPPLSIIRPRIRVEDGGMRSEFGQEWEEWARKVPYKLVPGVY